MVGRTATKWFPSGEYLNNLTSDCLPDENSIRYKFKLFCLYSASVAAADSVLMISIDEKPLLELHVNCMLGLIFLLVKIVKAYSIKPLNNKHKRVWGV